jgi:hypothetical protein
LSGLLFSIYINEVANLFDNCNAVFYADDLVLFCSSTCIQEIQDTLQLNIDKLLMWCENNFIEINVDKTKSMLVRPPRQSTQPVQIIIDKKIIENVQCFRYLGVTIDDKVSWNEHFENVCESMNSRSFLINRHKSSVSQNWLHIISTGIILTVLDYCFPVWGNLPKVKYARLDSIMFRVIKMIFPNHKYQKRNKYTLYEKVNWLTAAERYEFYCLSFIHKNIAQRTSLTHSLSEYFIKIPESDRVTRNVGCFVLPRMRTEFGKGSFFYQTIKVWICLPYEIRSCSSCTFDPKVRDFLVRCRNNEFVCSSEARIINHNNC